MRQRSIGLPFWFLVAVLTFWTSTPITEGTGGKRIVRARPIAAGASVAGAPDGPILLAPFDGAAGVTLSPILQVTVADPDSDLLNVTYFGRPSTGHPPQDFTIIHLTDTQFYSESNPSAYQTITEWVYDAQPARNIIYLSHTGDLVNRAEQIVQWERADTSMSVLEQPFPPYLPEGIPYGVTPGNHDMFPMWDPDGTENYNLYFGIDRFIGRSHYGGNYGTNNDNNYSFFSAAGMDFIVVYLEFDPTPEAEILAWAEGLLQTYPNHRAIVASHYIMEIGEQSPFSVQGQAIYDALKDNPNLFLMLAGHKHGEGKRVDVFDGRVVWTLLADYQSEPNQGNGWTRLLEFSPASDEIRVSTYSPTLDQWQTDADSQFVLNYEMDAGAPFVELGTVSGVPSGGTASLIWPELEPNQGYEWYVEVSDDSTVTTGPVWAFTSGCSAATDCDDDQSCTIDDCNSAVCVYTNDDLAACEDGDACTVADRCLDGICSGEPATCMSGFACDPDSGQCLPLPQTVSFQQQAAGYDGAVDTTLISNSPDTNNGDSGTLIADRIPERHALIRFDGLFAPEGGPIPLGAEILSAELTINVTNESPGVGASLHRMLQTWEDSDTWNTWGDGIQADGVEAAVGADASSGSGLGLHTFSVTPSLVNWAAGEPNHGWAWLPPITDNSWQFDSAEGFVTPKLEVTFKPVCQLDIDCDDGDSCNGLEACSAGGCLTGTPIDCGSELCDPANGNCVDCLSHADCADGDLCNGLEVCAAGGCSPGTPPDCSDSVDCTDDSCDPALGCIQFDNCPADAVCTPAIGVCEPTTAPVAGDLIIAGFQAVGAPEFIELFNTTGREIDLSSLELIARVDNDGDGVVDLDWELNADTGGRTIQPHGFFLIAEPNVQPGPADLQLDMNLPSGEGGTNGRAIGIELLVEGTHMDHLLYGRHDGSSPPGEIPPGDLPFDGFPGNVRTEVIRTLSGNSFFEGVTQRLTTEDLHAGYAVPGFYTDEAALPGDYPPGVWASLHAIAGTYQARSSAYGVVLPPGCTPGEVQALILVHEQSTTLSWTPQVMGTHYDVVSGGLLELDLNHGTHDAGCLANGLFSAEWVDPRPAPPGGVGFYYLVRAQNDCASGSYGFGSPSNERTPAACP